MKVLDSEWTKAVAYAIGKSETEVLHLIERWWNNNQSLNFINNSLMRLAEENGKKLILVDQNGN
jgi:hypothetical protein